jgi:hypothetical protein
MNVALSAVIIFILLIPGFALYVGLYTGNFQRPGPKLSLLESLLIAGLFSLLVHRIALCWIDQPIRFDILLRLLGVDFKESIKVQGAVENGDFRHLLIEFIKYNFWVNLSCLVFGRLLRLFLQATQLDWRISIFRLQNRWWYFLNGYYLDSRQFDFVVIDALVSTSEGSVLYTGYLDDFVCEGESLDRIYLYTPLRRKLVDGFPPRNTINPTPPGLTYDLEGDHLCLPYKEIQNLVVRFVRAEDADAAARYVIAQMGDAPPEPELP